MISGTRVRKLEFIWAWARLPLNSAVWDAHRPLHQLRVHLLCRMRVAATQNDKGWRQVSEIECQRDNFATFADKGVNNVERASVF